MVSSPSHYSYTAQKVRGFLVVRVKWSSTLTGSQYYQFDWLNWLYWNMWWQQYSYWAWSQTQAAAASASTNTPSNGVRILTTCIYEHPLL